MAAPEGPTYLHHPDMKDDDPKKNGLICWMDKDRECGADCMAFGEPPTQLEYQGMQWANCMLLVNAHRVGKHLVVLAQVSTERLQKQKAADADRARSAQSPPPTPR